MAKLNLEILFCLIFLVGCTSINNTEIDKKVDDKKNNFEIINAHEHVQSFLYVDKLIKAMGNAGISKTFLVGSPQETIFGGEGFSEYDKNNKQILEIIKAYPDRFNALCTLDPRDNQSLEKLKECIDGGAKGLKLYSGHYASFYKYIGPLNRTEMGKVYKYCEENNIPILFHINPGKGNLMVEFEDLLIKYPNLIVNCPHFCLSSVKLSRLEYIFDNYPNVYTDVSFGFFAKDGFERLSKNVTKYANFIKKYGDRFMFGTDMVVTSNKRKSTEWTYNLTMCYRNMLEKERYICSVGNEINGEFNGLRLDEETLRIIYNDVPKKFLNLNY